MGSFTRTRYTSIERLLVAPHSGQQTSGSSPRRLYPHRRQGTSIAMRLCSSSCIVAGGVRKAHASSAARANMARAFPSTISSPTDRIAQTSVKVPRETVPQSSGANTPNSAATSGVNANPHASVCAVASHPVFPARRICRAMHPVNDVSITQKHVVVR